MRQCAIRLPGDLISARRFGMIPPSYCRGPLRHSRLRKGTGSLNPNVTQTPTTGATATAGSPTGANSATQPPQLRLLLICQAEGMHSRYSELSTEDSGLTARGWEQTNILAAWLATHEKIDVLVCAPQLRSRLTAQRIGQAIGRPVIVQQDLPHQPRNFPNLLPTRSESAPRFPPLYVEDQFNSDALYMEFSQQMAAVLDKLVEENSGKTLAMVLDGNGVAVALRHCLGALHAPIAVNHTSISETNWQQGRWSLMYANRMEHFPQPPLTKSEAPAEQAAAEARALEEELSQITNIYNRVLSSSVSLNDQSRDQRLRHFLRFANLPAGQRVLDVGTGNGRLGLMLADDGAREVVGIDISPAMLEVAEYLRASSPSPNAGRVNFRLAAAQSVPFRSEGFDAALCRLVLHHARRPDDLLRELVRVLKPNGVFVLADLLAADDPVRRATQNTIEARRNPSHVAMYTADQYRKLLTNAGLTIESETVAVFERELDDWLNDLQSDPSNRAVVREMIEAGLETDATGLKVRRQGGKLVFDQRLFYARAVKK
jgi:ubiquinone/menaquinone biosynthesis C-methylase UbiE/broad specificity phosphatase PhoE